MKRLSLKSFGVREERIYRERSEKMREFSLTVYIESHKSQQNERRQGLKRLNQLWKSYRGSVERCPQQEGLDGSRSY